MTAGRLWGFAVPANEGIDVLVGNGRRVRAAGVRSHRTGALFSAEIVACVLAALAQSGRIGAA